MEELKTLKDICNNPTGYLDWDIHAPELREEAIRHIKALTHDNALCLCIPASRDICAAHKHAAQVEWIKEFFNIDEEELK